MPSTTTSPMWLLLLCRSCGSRMKVRPELATAGKILCPACRAVVSVRDLETAGEKPVTEAPPPDPGVSPGEPRGEIESPISTQTAAPHHPHQSQGRVTGHAAFVADLRDGVGARETDGQFQARLRTTDEMPSQPQVVKKRRKQGHVAVESLADWDSSSVDFIPEAELSVDEWDRAVLIPEEAGRQRERSFAVGKGMTPGGEQVELRKKVRKRRAIAGARLFFVRFTRGARYLIIGLAALIALAGAVWGIKAAGEASSTPELPAVKPEDVKPPDRGLLTAYDTAGAREVIEKFMAAATVAEKLEFVRTRERVKPLMEAWYESHPAGPFKVGDTNFQQKLTDANGYFIVVAAPVIVPSQVVPGTADEVPTFFAVEELREGSTSTYKLDWEVTVGWQPVPFAKLREEMPKTPLTFRFKIERWDYYHHNYTDETKWQCVRLRYPTFAQQSEVIFGYIDRTSTEGQRIIDLLGDASLESELKPSVQVEIVYPQDSVSRDQVEVVKLVDISWFAPEETPAGKTPESK